MNDGSIRRHPIPRLHPSRATADILRILDHHIACFAPQGRRESRMRLGMSGRVALKGDYRFALDRRLADDTTLLRGVRTAFEIFADRGAALHFIDE